MPLTPHDEDLVMLPERVGYDDSIEMVEGMDDSQDPTIQRMRSGRNQGMKGLGDLFPSINIVTLALLGLAGWFVYTKFIKKN